MVEYFNWCENKYFLWNKNFHLHIGKVFHATSSLAEYNSRNVIDVNTIGKLTFFKLIVFPIHPWAGTKSLAKSAITDRPLHGQ